MNSIVLGIHMFFGSTAILAGFSTTIPRKGSRWHILFGKVFYFAMLTMAGAASYLAVFSSHETINAFIGLYTIYLVLTSRWAAANEQGTITTKEKIGVLISGTLFIAFLLLTISAVQGGEPIIDGVYVEAFYLYTFLSALTFALDLKILIKGGVFGKQRIARHLWRMLLALFIAAASLFLGQPQVFPEKLQSSGLLGVPVALVVLILLFWIVRVFIGRRFGISQN